MTMQLHPALGDVARQCGRARRGPGSAADAEKYWTLLQEALRNHAAHIYDLVTETGRRRLRMTQVVARTRDLVPGLLADARELREEAAVPVDRRHGWERADMELLRHCLLDPYCGSHLLESMRLPLREADELAARFTREGAMELGPVRVARRGAIAYVTMAGIDNLNAEDLGLLQALELATDVVLLDTHSRVGVLRGDVMRHPKYRGQRVFCAGINLKKLGTGEIPLVGFLLEREAGYLAKLLHGHASGGAEPAPQAKPWVAAVDGFAIGGGAQVLLVCDRVVVEHGGFVSLPAAQEGIVPGAANLRLTRTAGPRQARRMILGGQRVVAGAPGADAFFDVLATTDEMDQVIEREAAALTDDSVMANRVLINESWESVEDLRTYLAAFAGHQAGRARSDDVMAKTRSFASGGGR